MKLKPIFCGLLAIAAAVGCKKEIPLEPKLVVNRSAAEVGAEGGNLTVEITSNTEWTAKADKAWVTAVTPSQGKASEEPVTVTVSVEANADAEPRTAVVTFTAGTLTKTTEITQAGKTEGGGDEVVGSDSELYVLWAFSADMKQLNEATWHQAKNDLEAGLSDRYLAATIGNGDIKYHQVDKSGFSTDKIRRHTGSKGEPLAYGCWEGDYFLFEATHSLAENANASICFGVQGKSGTPKYWLLEYKDGELWKPAIETESLGEITYNVECTKDNPTIINAAVVIGTATEKVQFRLTCVSKIAIDNTEKTAPVDNTYIRIDPSSVIIKGGAITDDEINAIVAPAMNVTLEDEKTSISVDEAEASETVSVTSNIDWIASSNQSWVSVLPPSGLASESATEVTVMIAENSTESPRGATLTFTGTYGNATIVKTVDVSQAGKEPEPVVGTDCDLFVAWALSADMKAVNEETWKQSENDLNPGDGEKYVGATTGTGKITYSQVDKNSFDTDKIYRHTGKAGEPMVYGAWVGDYFLFEADYNLPANSNVSIAFALLGGSDKALKYWLLEYKDGAQWKMAGVEGMHGDAAYNVICGTKEQHTLVNKSVVITNATDKIQFRLTCVSNYRLDGQSMNSPGGNTYIRMNRDYTDASATEHIPIIIKGGTITEEDFSNVEVPTPTPDPEPEPDPDPTDLLNVKWEWNANQEGSWTDAEAALYAARTATWHQADTDPAAGDGGKYIDANVGTGRLTFVQQDKSAYASSTMRRHLGKNAEPVIYGAWENDYFLFEASDGQTYPAGTKVSISFGIKANKSAVKTWRLEYFDGGEWKTALAEVSFTTKTQTVNATVTAAASNSALKFRLLCISQVDVDKGAAMDVPAGNQRLDSTIPLEIKVIE